LHVSARVASAHRVLLRASDAIHHFVLLRRTGVRGSSAAPEVRRRLDRRNLTGLLTLDDGGELWSALWLGWRCTASAVVEHSFTLTTNQLSRVGAGDLRQVLRSQGFDRPAAVGSRVLAVASTNLLLLTANRVVGLVLGTSNCVATIGSTSVDAGLQIRSSPTALAERVASALPQPLRCILSLTASGRFGVIRNRRVGSRIDRARRQVQHAISLLANPRCGVILSLATTTVAGLLLSLFLKSADLRRGIFLTCLSGLLTGDRKRGSARCRHGRYVRCLSATLTGQIASTPRRFFGLLRNVHATGDRSFATGPSTLLFRAVEHALAFFGQTVRA
jgi:hypothetical protein